MDDYSSAVDEFVLVMVAFSAMMYIAECKVFTGLLVMMMNSWQYSISAKPKNVYRLNGKIQMAKKVIFQSRFS